MRYVVLGRSGLRVSAIGLGCMGMSHAYGAPADVGEMTRLISDAVDMGYTLFDTAEVYGPDGNPQANEELVGNALLPYRDKVAISTKFGITIGGGCGRRVLRPDSRPEAIRRSVVGSLRRLHTDYIDLYFQHRIDPSVPPEEVAGVMSDLIGEGKILHWGISEATEDYLRRAHSVCPVTAIQNRYSMMARWHENLLPVIEELGVGFVAFSPLANGFLSNQYASSAAFDPEDDYRAFMPQFAPGSYRENSALVKLVEDLAARQHATPSQVSLAWMMCKHPAIVPIPGVRHLCHLKENAGATDITMSEREISEIDAALRDMKMSEVYGGSPVGCNQNR